MSQGVGAHCCLPKTAWPPTSVYFVSAGGSLAGRWETFAAENNLEFIFAVKCICKSTEWACVLEKLIFLHFKKGYALWSALNFQGACSAVGRPMQCGTHGRVCC